jgi:hypothetical protein
MATDTPFIQPDIEKGNIDLSYRDLQPNPDMSTSSVSSMSIGSTDRQGNLTTILIPTVVGGKRLSRQQAIDYYKQTGQHLGKFSRQPDADEFSKMLSDRQGQNPNNKPTIFDAVNKALEDLKRGN